MVSRMEEVTVDGPKQSGRLVGTLAVYIAFLVVGNGCGWFVANSLWQTLANVPEVTQDGRMFGKVTLIMGIVGLVVALFYVLSLARGSMTIRIGQCLSSLLIAMSVAVFGMLALFWDAGAPEYPVFILATVLGSAVASATYFILFPLISTFYGGWLIAPVRAGTDLSILVTSLLGEAQNPAGTRNLFPMSVLYCVYMALSACGLVAWLVILKFKVGLREGAVVEEQENEKQEQGHAEVQDAEQPGGSIDTASLGKAVVASGMEVGGDLTLLGKVKYWLRELACPKSLIGPVICATLSQVLQWSLVYTITQIGSLMTDPAGCSGASGRETYRIALTSSSIAVPVGSALSSYSECPRWLFYLLSGLQVAASIAVVMATAGVGQEMWFTVAGRVLYIGCVAISAGTEGYVLTMAYRYIGDGDGLPMHVRLSASSLLSFLSVAVVNPASIMIGVFVDTGVIACMD